MTEPLKRYQIWFKGSELYAHCYAKSDARAMAIAQEMIYHDFNCKAVEHDLFCVNVEEI